MFKKNQVSCRSSKRKIKRKFRRNNLYSLYENHQEKISYRKAKLLLEKAETRQLKAKVNKDHCYTLKSSTLRQTTKKDHTYSISMTVKSSNHPITKCKVENAPSCSFHVLSRHHVTYFLNEVPKPGDPGLCKVSHDTDG